jgi:His/Glu/Gln/Arg/opine family amino acid ABC transporter permease subunit
MIAAFGEVLFEHLPDLVSGYGITIALVAIAFIGSLAVGTLLASVRLAPVPVLPSVARAQVELFRNTPLLVQMYLIFFGLGSIGIRFSPFTAGAIALSLYTGAYVSEVLRAGVLTVPAGQVDAARSIGLDFVGTLRSVILPQAFRAVIPPLGNLFIAMIKNSAIAAAIGTTDLLYHGQVLDGQTFATFEIYTGVLIGYLSLTLPSAALVHRLERRLAIKR